MIAEYWLYDLKHLIKKLKIGADIVDSHELESLHQYRAKLISELIEVNNETSSQWFQRVYLSNLVITSFSDNVAVTDTSAKLKKATLPKFIGNESQSVNIFSSIGHKKFIKSSQEEISNIIEYSTPDNEMFNYYYILGDTIYVYPPSIDDLSGNMIYSNPFEAFTTKVLVINGETVSPAGTSRLVNMYDEYPLEREYMFDALMLHMKSKYGIEQQALDDLINNEQDELNLTKYAKG